jgi:hypothetical protein
MLYEYCREVAEAETRTITIMPKSDFKLPQGHYRFIEMFCNDPGCDCRRCFFMVRADWSQEPVATIGFGWESPEFYTRWMGDDELSAMLSGVNLEPMQRPSEHASEILRMFKAVLLPNHDYIERVKRHYALMRSVVDGERKRPNTAKERKKRKKEKERQLMDEPRRLHVTTTNAQGEKIVKRFDKSTYRHPKGKISEAFLQFVEPLVASFGENSPPRELVETVLKMGRTVWNTAVLDTTEGGTKHVGMLLANAKKDQRTRLMIESLIQRKQADFGDNQRLLGEYKFIPEGHDGFHLQIEARNPLALN